LSTNLRLLLDESVTDVLARLIEGCSSAINVEYVRDLSIKGAPDNVVVAYATDNRRIVVTTETGMNHMTFPVCTHSGIIVLTGKSRHEFIHAENFRKFLLSGRRQETQDAVTYLNKDNATIKKHQGDLQFKLE
jgi:predicted nuclease of predicted toxin-antitoxin system